MAYPLILTFSAVYLPGYKSGGPIQSVANMVAYLGSQFAFRIVTSDRDAGDDAPYFGADSGRWQPVGKAQVRYVAPSAQTIPAIARIMRETPHDIVYLNSFFHWRSSVLPLLVHKLGMAPRKPVILAPRGEFSEGALAIKSGKKHFFIKIVRGIGLHRGVLWHASTKHEATDIRTVFGAGQLIHVASNLPRAVQHGLGHVPRSAGQPLRLLFLSRISPKKNLGFVLDVLSRVAVPVNLSIVGPISDPAYWSECQARIVELPPHIKVSYDGMVLAEQAPSAMAKNDLFFLPTLGENFGHAIIEALGAGTPAMISDKTPWQDFDRAGCGWVLSLDDPQAFADHIDALFLESGEESARRREAALDYARRFEADGSMVDDNRTLFLRAMKSALA